MDNCYRTKQHKDMRHPAFAKTCNTQNCANPRHRVLRLTPTPVSSVDKCLGHVHLPSDAQQDCWGWSGPLNFNGMTPEVYVTLKAAGLQSRPKGFRPIKTCRNPFCCNPQHLVSKKDHTKRGLPNIPEEFFETVRSLRQEVAAFQAAAEAEPPQNIIQIPTLSQPASAQDVYFADRSRTLFLRLICNTAKLHHPECAAELDAIRDRNHEVAGLCLVHRHKLVVACATAVCHHTPDLLTFTFITPEDLRREFP